MPKMKTHKATAKRFKRTGSGKWVRARANRIHRHNKTKRAKRELDKKMLVSPADEKRVERLLPYH
ncbi:MAG: 50S ribosomal protein L35 [Bacillota bacterium]|nr:50S ribosomal protein L35 [Bacillota bacterium]